jgi:hypothetical protein
MIRLENLKINLSKIIGLTLILASLMPLNQGVINAQDGNDTHQVETYTADDGRQIDVITISGRPPETKAAAVADPEPKPAMGINTLLNVPAFDWSYGCSATSAAMMFGYYDNDGYHTNMYAGPTNAGVCPIDNSSWGSGECPLSATHNGIDERAIYGHVDDYWVSYGSNQPDPYQSGHWTEHTHADCTADFMGTNQYTFGNPDGSTTFWNFTNGAPFGEDDVIAYLNPTNERDGGHGLQLFAESRGYNVSDWYNQYIDVKGLTYGFTYAQYTAEIDAGRPVLIHVTNHTMLGYGYDDSTDTLYIHDTWDHSSHTMTWGGSYEGLDHYGVTVFQLEDTSGPTWESYKETPGGTVDDYFSDYGTENTVYMYGASYEVSTYYRVIYWDEVDGTWYKRQTEDKESDSGGTLELAHTFGGPDTDENWHCTVYDSGYSPITYDPDDTHIVADDVSYTGVYAFNVEGSAIPEFPTVLAAVAVTGLCAGIYFWMRRKVTVRIA